jgi:predicted nucleic-acid-binding protein
MISLDTNVVVRFVVQDDELQNGIVNTLFEQNTVFIANTVLLESEWVIRGTYGFTREQVNDFFEVLLDHQSVEFEDSTVLRIALGFFVGGLDFADALHLVQTRGRFATFDKRLVNCTKKLGNTPETYIPV